MIMTPDGTCKLSPCGLLIHWLETPALASVFGILCHTLYALP